MKSNWLKRVALIAATVLCLLVVPVAHTQDTGNVRVVRLSLAEGQVLVSHAGSNVWEEAPANLPLLEGDTLATQGGYAEIEFENGATAYLAENSVLQFTQLGFSGGGRATDLTLTQGAGTFYATLTSQDSFRVEAKTFNVAIPERAEFRVDGFQDGAAVQVFVGDVSVSTTRGSTDLEKGQSLAVHEKDFQDVTIGSLPTAEDAFDEWVTEEGEMIRAGNKNTLTYINSPNIYGLSDLSRYGTWVNVAGFGYSWRPFSVGFTWTPYFNGRWISNPTLGWVWVSGEPWGWMPFHFGSWLLSPDLGWLWVPGGTTGLRQFEPSRVNWVSVGDHVGWVAKSPNDRAGVPANAAQGVIVKSSRSSGNGIESNEIVSGKDLLTIAPLKQPPAEFASRPAAVVSHPGVQATTRLTPWTSNNTASIVYDQGTHTFINRDGSNQRTGNQPIIGNTAPVAPAVLMPRSVPQAEVPRVTPPPPNPAGSRANRVILPPAYPIAPRGNVPANGMSPIRPPMSAPLSTQPRPVVPQPAVPRPAAPPPAPPLQPVSPPPAPRAAPAQPGSVGRPVAQTPHAASPPTPGEHR